jgi:mitogen-activated protein kinase kinase kinase
MDAATGLLMAVKQVSLPTGSGVNQERKKAMLSALEREIELLRELQHENIVQYHGTIFFPFRKTCLTLCLMGKFRPLASCMDQEHLNIFLEYVPGGSVTALLRNYGAFEETLVKNFVRQILNGLAYLHEKDIIHRDIKGANILVDNKGGIKISDFGISKKVEDSALCLIRFAFGR